VDVRAAGAGGRSASLDPARRPEGPRRGRAGVPAQPARDPRRRARAADRRRAREDDARGPQGARLVGLLLPRGRRTRDARLDEREELARYPEEEAEELALIYAARGVPIEKARELTREMQKDPEQMLDTLAREELGLNPDDLGSPWGAAISSFFAFATGAFVPL